MIKTYRDLKGLSSFIERYNYLKLSGVVGSQTFGCHRYVNQELYKSKYWREVIRSSIILRDNGCDLGIDGREINDSIIVHHINPITLDDILDGSDAVFDPDNLISVSKSTHLAIHYGDESLLMQTPIERYPGDTCPWKKKGG